MSDPQPSEPNSRVPWWHWINWLALDAVAVAVVWLWMFAGMTGARLTAVNSLVVGAAVVLHFVTTLAAWWQPPTHPTHLPITHAPFSSAVPRKQISIRRGDIWRIADHPNQGKYPGQRLFFVVIDNYIYIVPFEMRDEVIWLVTIIPSRKATKRYLEDQGHETE